MEKWSSQRIRELMTPIALRGMAGNKIGCARISMMVRSMSSNTRPDTLMQDRILQAYRFLLQRTAGPYIGVRLGPGAMSAQCPVCPKADKAGVTRPWASWKRTSWGCDTHLNRMGFDDRRLQEPANERYDGSPLHLGGHALLRGRPLRGVRGSQPDGGEPATSRDRDGAQGGAREEGHGTQGTQEAKPRPAENLARVHSAVWDRR